MIYNLVLGGISELEVPKFSETSNSKNIIGNTILYNTEHSISVGDVVKYDKDSWEVVSITLYIKIPQGIEKGVWQEKYYPIVLTKKL